MRSFPVLLLISHWLSTFLTAAFGSIRLGYHFRMFDLEMFRAQLKRVEFLRALVADGQQKFVGDFRMFGKDVILICDWRVESSSACAFRTNYLSLEIGIICTCSSLFFLLQRQRYFWRRRSWFCFIRFSFCFYVREVVEIAVILFGYQWCFVQEHWYLVLHCCCICFYFF